MSNINTTNIDNTYPKQGQDNPSQGFRDNFSYIKIALDTAASEITALQEMANLSTTTDFLGLLVDLQMTAANTNTHLSLLDSEVARLTTTATNNFNSIIAINGQLSLLQSNTSSFLRTYTGNISASNINALGNISGGSLTVYGTTNLNTVSNVTITGGTNGQVLTTNGHGQLSWTTVSGGGGGSLNIIGNNWEPLQDNWNFGLGVPGSGFTVFDSTSSYTSEVVLPWPVTFLGNTYTSVFVCYSDLPSLLLGLSFGSAPTGNLSTIGNPAVGAPMITLSIDNTGFFNVDHQSYGYYYGSDSAGTFRVGTGAWDVTFTQSSPVINVQVSGTDYYC